MAERNQGVPEDRRMLFRIGINLGDILIEGDDILGDGVICISSSAYPQLDYQNGIELLNVPVDLDAAVACRREAVRSFRFRHGTWHACLMWSTVRDLSSQRWDRQCGRRHS